MDISFNCASATISANNGRTVSVNIEEVEHADILENFNLNDIFQHFTAADILNYFSKDEVIEHFNITEAE